MPTIKLGSSDEVQKWGNILHTCELLLTILNEEKETLETFCESRLQTAQFWKRYAYDRTADAKLREITSQDLAQVQLDIELLDSVVPTKLGEIVTLLKQYKPESSRNR